MVSNVAGVAVVIGFPVLMMVAMLLMERVEQRTVVTADEPEPTASPDRPASTGLTAGGPHLSTAAASALSVTATRAARPALRLVRPLPDDPGPDPDTGSPAGSVGSASVGSGASDA